MRIQEAPRRRMENISVQEIGDETLVYDELRHKAFCLNPSSAAIWRLATGEQSIAQMSARASRELHAEIGEEFVTFAVEELRRDGLIEPSEAAAAIRPISRRRMLQRLGVGGAMLLPVVASIVAPTAAQAYSGCFDCSDTQSIRASQFARVNQMERAQRQQRSAENGDLFGPLSPYPRQETPPPDDPFPR